MRSPRRSQTQSKAEPTLHGVTQHLCAIALRGPSPAPVQRPDSQSRSSARRPRSSATLRSGEHDRPQRRFGVALTAAKMSHGRRDDRSVRRTPMSAKARPIPRSTPLRRTSDKCRYPRSQSRALARRQSAAATHIDGYRRVCAVRASVGSLRRSPDATCRWQSCCRGGATECSGGHPIIAAKAGCAERPVHPGNWRSRDRSAVTRSIGKSRRDFPIPLSISGTADARRRACFFSLGFSRRVRLRAADEGIEMANRHFARSRTCGSTQPWWRSCGLSVRATTGRATRGTPSNLIDGRLRRATLRRASVDRCGPPDFRRCHVRATSSICSR